MLILNNYKDICFFFFFQAEDGIRDYTVTGVQTCALPISSHIDLGDRRSLAGVDVFRRQDHVEPTVEIDDISLAERTGDDFHGRNPSIGDEPGDQAGED